MKEIMEREKWKYKVVCCNAIDIVLADDEDLVIASITNDSYDLREFDCAHARMIVKDHNSHTALLEALGESELRIKFLLHAIQMIEIHGSGGKGKILDRIDAEKTIACLKYIKQAVEEAENE